jgi:hypothetical protein
MHSHAVREYAGVDEQTPGLARIAWTHAQQDVFHTDVGRVFRRLPRYEVSYVAGVVDPRNPEPAQLERPRHVVYVRNVVTRALDHVTAVIDETVLVEVLDVEREVELSSLISDHIPAIW